MEVQMVDRYTKAVLTVIACALVIIALQGTKPVAHAQGQAESYPIHVIVDGVVSGALRFAGPIQVRQ